VVNLSVSLGSFLLLAGLLTHCALATYNHGRDTNREISRYLSGFASVRQLTSPQRKYEMYFIKEAENEDPATEHIKLIVVENKTNEIAYQDRIRGIDISWQSDHVVAVTVPIGILNEQDSNTRRYLVDIEKRKGVEEQGKEGL
jgi:hypothetical protein